MPDIHTRGTRPVTPVILAGGSGTRLWPLSRQTMPKQFQPLMGEVSPFQQTLLRVVDSRRFDAPMIVTTEELLPIARTQARAIGVEPGAIVVEPAGRNTAPAILAAAVSRLREVRDTNLLVLPSDHQLEMGRNFDDAVAQATNLADAGDLFVTFGVVPTGPETGYGYIRRGSPLVSTHGYLVKGFIEKPAVDVAEALLADGDVYWNSGMFCFPARGMVEELRHFEPVLVSAVEASVEDGALEDGVRRLEPVAYDRARATSIDYALMERTNRAAVVPLAAAWSDIGSWDSVWATAADKDDAGNVCLGSAVIHDGNNNYVRSDRGLTAVVGLDDVVVVSLDDAVLVADRKQAQAIKPLVDRLRREAGQIVREPATVQRPWGTYCSVDRGPTHQVKHITVEPEGRLSLQYHHHRSEHWTVVSGIAVVTVDERIRILTANESVYIPQGAVHRLENPGTEPLHLIEVQCGSYLGEDDIVRVEDVYGRTATPVEPTESVDALIDG